ncbi:hypothetical protein NECID01_0565 [Nematocida sp. AWRm77]|nr:hypothetical protein NECID01_0565 [Nematocida sp. AWRm77]
MGGFVVTCINGGYRKGLQEAIKALEMALFSLSVQSFSLDGSNQEKTLREEIEEEKNRMKKSNFAVLGGKRDSEILFIKNNSSFSEIEIYNSLVQNTNRVHFIRRVVPVQSIFTLTPETLKSEVMKVASRISPEDTFRISLKKRLCSHFSSECVVSIAAECIPSKVDLGNPSKVLMIEIAKDLCGIGALKPCPGNYNLARNPAAQ